MNGTITTRAERSTSIHDMVLLSLFTAIIILMACTPLGLIDLPIIKATILHIPVIIGAILLGPGRGAFLGAVFGLTSLVKNTMIPGVLSFAFSPLIPVPGTDHGSLWALFISMVPRMLIGPGAWAVYTGLHKLLGRKTAARGLEAAVAGASGAIINTALVMGTMGSVLRDGYAAAKGIPVDAVTSAVMAVVLANGVPETVAAAVLVPAIVVPLQKALKRDA
ncbi:ECF transporter S component [Pseudoflavonifractor sp. MSJ-37]|uniref:ECF transporter S component n=1 Tax=Pseudoflavonifractor sp. MSJ-37 TaxID=2841531 RepID=UPI001C11C07B|nr:ECF transporter S component [Pseudoflavonifractor sp. MSJ-37]MBU5435290.1 ECF transporter S component [Pseudoflavonifractor sp. MSJ-37]